MIKLLLVLNNVAPPCVSPLMLTLTSRTLTVDSFARTGGCCIWNCALGVTVLAFVVYFPVSILPPRMLDRQELNNYIR